MVYLSRIYTKSGDQGQTSLGDGQRVAKDSARVTAYGEIDELNSLLGLVRANCPDILDSSLLMIIQNDLFDLGGDLCIPQQEGESPDSSLRVTEEQVLRLERAIDRRNEALQPLNSFVLPGGSVAAAWLHVARSVCRRAERSVSTLMQQEAINIQVLIYLNRLSDYLFVLARAMNDNGKSDVLWVPGKNRNE